MTPNILLSIIKLAAGGIVTFMAILLMSKSRDSSWVFMVCGFLMTYAATIYDIMIKLGVLAETSFCLFGIPITTLIAAVLPSLFFVIGFIVMLIKKR